MTDTYNLRHWILNDLDITHYYGKWKCAVEFADSKFQVDTFDWYATARKHFLELGGCYLHERVS